MKYFLFIFTIFTFALSYAGGDALAPYDLLRMQQQGVYELYQHPMKFTIGGQKVTLRVARTMGESFNNGTHAATFENIQTGDCYRVSSAFLKSFYPLLSHHPNWKLSKIRLTSEQKDQQMTFRWAWGNSDFQVQDVQVLSDGRYQTKVVSELDHQEHVISGNSLLLFINEVLRHVNPHPIILSRQCTAIEEEWE